MSRLTIAIFTASMIALEDAGKAAEVKPMYYRRGKAPTRQLGRADSIQERSVDNALQQIAGHFPEGDALICRTSDGKSDKWVAEYKIKGALAKEDHEEEVKKKESKKGQPKAKKEGTALSRRADRKDALAKRMQTRHDKFKAIADAAMSRKVKAEAEAKAIREEIAAKAAAKVEAPAAPAATESAPAPQGEVQVQTNDQAVLAAT